MNIDYVMRYITCYVVENDYFDFEKLSETYFALFQVVVMLIIERSVCFNCVISLLIFKKYAKKSKNMYNCVTIIAFPKNHNYIRNFLLKKKKLAENM